MSSSMWQIFNLIDILRIWSLVGFACVSVALTMCKKGKEPENEMETSGTTTRTDSRQKKKDEVIKMPYSPKNPVEKVKDEEKKPGTPAKSPDKKKEIVFSKKKLSIRSVKKRKISKEKSVEQVERIDDKSALTAKRDPIFRTAQSPDTNTIKKKQRKRSKGTLKMDRIDSTETTQEGEVQVQNPHQNPDRNSMKLSKKAKSVYVGEAGYGAKSKNGQSWRLSRDDYGSNDNESEESSGGAAGGTGGKVFKPRTDQSHYLDN